jgi:orotidine-5'-phosphate decarboxylase
VPIAPSAPRTLDEARRRLLVALDVASPDEGRALVDELGPAAAAFKVGLELWARGGRDLAIDLAREGRDVFVDLKLHDIPQTVASAACAIADAGAFLTTVHGPPSAVTAAARAVDGSGLRLLGVTVLTSMDEAEWRESWGLGDGRPLAQVVRDRAASLVRAGCDGLVCSPLEVAALRAAHPGAVLVTPGVRPEGGDAADQKRVATPRAAASAGADYLVVGRPIRDAPDRRAACEAIVAEMLEGFGSA